MKKEYQALDLFGGRDVVLGRMNYASRKELKKISLKDRSLLEECLHIKPGTLTKIASSRRKMDVELFNKVGMHIGVSMLDDVPGEPKYSKDAGTRKDWKLEDKKRGYFAAIPMQTTLDESVRFIAWSELNNEGYSSQATVQAAA